METKTYVLHKSRRAEPEGSKKVFGGKWYIKTETGWKPIKQNTGRGKEPDRGTGKQPKEEPKQSRRTPRGQRPGRQSAASARAPADTSQERERKLKIKLKLAVDFLRDNNISAEAATKAFVNYKELSSDEQAKTPLSVYLTKEAIKETK